MPNDGKTNVSFSASAEDYIRRFMKVAEESMPNASLVPVIAWWTDGTFTDEVTGKVTKLGPSIGVGAIDTKELTDELIVPMGDLKVALQLPDELQSADRHLISWTVLSSSPTIDLQSLRRIASATSDLFARPHSRHV
jgi:hypothetical protein